MGIAWEEYEDMRLDYYDSLAEKKFITIADARAKGANMDFVANPPAPAPNKLGITPCAYSLEHVCKFIDWNPFFATWELRGKYPNRGYPKIFNDEAVGSEAKKLFDDATSLLKEIVDGKLLEMKGVVGIWAANTVGDDVEVYAGEERSEVLGKFCMLRQQMEKENPDDAYMCQSDFVAPKETGVQDYMGVRATHST